MHHCGNLISSQKVLGLILLNAVINPHEHHDSKLTKTLYKNSQPPTDQPNGSQRPQESLRKYNTTISPWTLYVCYKELLQGLHSQYKCLKLIPKQFKPGLHQVVFKMLNLCWLITFSFLEFTQIARFTDRVPVWLFPFSLLIWKSFTDLHLTS